MANESSTLRARLVEALECLGKVLAVPSAQFPYTIGYLRADHDAQFPQVAAVYKAGNAVYQALMKIGAGHVDVDVTIAPRRQLLEIERFILEDVGQLDRLPAPPSFPRKLRQFIEDLGGKALLPAATANDARDEWLYDLAMKTVAWGTIRMRLAKKPKSWERIDSDNGVKKAARAYAHRHGLPVPPPRKAGRPKQ